MPKRFTDTEVWLEDWMATLSDSEMLFWFYLKDHCDQAGFWRPNFKHFETMTGRRINQNDFLAKMNEGKERIRVMENGRWCLMGFIPFQYGPNLDMKNHFHKSIYDTFRANVIFDFTSTYGFEVSEAKRGRKTKEQKGDVDSNDTKLPRNIIPPTIEMVKEYCDKRSNGIDPQTFIDYYNVRNWKPKGQLTKMNDWEAAVRYWERLKVEKQKSEHKETQQELFDRLVKEGKIPQKVSL
jgi:hypothetical protein